MLNLEGFRLIEAKALPELSLNDVPAVYVFLFKMGDRILETSGYFSVETRLPSRVGSHYHLYTGASAEVGSRLRQHLKPDYRVSTLRYTLLALERQLGAITNAGLAQHEVASESGLNEWLLEHAIVGVRECDLPFALERDLLRLEPSPLNIECRRSHAYSRILVGARERTFPRRTARDRPSICR